MSASPPAGSVLIKGGGLRFTFPIAVLAGVLGAAGTRLISAEQRLSQQAEHIRALERICEAKVRP